MLQSVNISLVLNNFNFYGCRMAQSVNMPLTLNNFLQNVKPKTIVEIGTYEGGLSILFQLHSLYFNSKFVTYDIKDYISNKKIFDLLKIDIRFSDVFKQETIDEIISLINLDGTTVLFCDGGNKIKEFNFFARYLKKGDYILAHDYASSVENFNLNIKGKIWNSCEIKDVDINESIKENSLERVFPEFENVAVVCYKK